MIRYDCTITKTQVPDFSHRIKYNLKQGYLLCSILMNSSLGKDVEEEDTQ